MPAQEVKVGDRVRSYDFPGIRTDCYIEGVVERIVRAGEPLFGATADCDRYEILIDKMTSDDGPMKLPKDLRAYPPVNGTPSWLGGTTNGVAKIGSEHA